MEPQRKDDAQSGVNDDLNRIDDSLLERLDQDKRIQSSVPAEHRGTDLAFIQMSGLVMPPKAQTADRNPLAQTDDDNNAEAPISFYEEGVDDVDSGAGPAGIETSRERDQEIVFEKTGASSVTDLRKIIADLAKEWDGTKPGEEETCTLSVDDEGALAANDECDASDPGDEDQPDPETAAVDQNALRAKDHGHDESDKQEDLPAAITGPGQENDDYEREPMTAGAPMESQPPLESGENNDIEQLQNLAPSDDDDAEPSTDDIGATGTPGSQSADQETGYDATSGEPTEPHPVSADARDTETFIDQLQNQPREQEAELSVDMEDREPTKIEQEPEPEITAEPPGAETQPIAVVESESLPAENEAALEDANEFPPPENEATVEPETEPATAEVRSGSGSETESEPVERDSDEWVYQRPQTHTKRRSSRRRSSRRRRRIVHWCVWTVVLAAVVVGGYFGYIHASQFLATPERSYSEAAALAAAAKYREASRRFQAFAEKYPNHSLRPSAQFEAAHTLRLASAEPGAPPDALERSLALLHTFVEENPGHANAARAQTLMGVVAFKLGRYDDAIAHLRDPELRLKDPAAALPALRILAQACAQTGDYAAARSAYLQAAAMPGNLTADADYYALGDMYRRLGEQTQDPGEARRYIELCLEQWERATLTSGIDQSTKKDIEIRCDALRERLSGMTADTPQPQGSIVPLSPEAEGPDAGAPEPKTEED